MTGHPVRWCLLGLSIIVSSAALAEGQSPPVLFLVNRGLIVPLGWGGASPHRITTRSARGGSEETIAEERRALLQSYLSPDRRYSFVGEGGSGTAIVTSAGKCAPEFLECAAMSADVRVEVDGQERKDARGLASDSTLRSVAPRGRRSLDEEDRKLLAVLAAKEFKKKVHRPDPDVDPEQARGWDGRLRSPKIAGYQQDLDGDGKRERVGIVQYGEREFAFAVLFVLRESADGKLRPENQVTLNATVSELGTVDVNGDGIDDVVLESGYYEWDTYDVWLSGKKGRRLVTIGGAGV